jgi:hypothetical protein
MNIRPDNIQLLTSIPAYINVGTTSGNIVISGTYATATSTNFTVSVPVKINGNRFDIYGKNMNNGLKQLLSTSNFISNDTAIGGGIYQHKTTEFVQLLTSQVNGSVTVTITVNNNSGATITLITQTIQISVVQYQIPY